MYQVRYITEDLLENGDKVTIYWGKAFDFMRLEAKVRIERGQAKSILMKRQELNGNRWMTTMTYSEFK